MTDDMKKTAVIKWSFNKPLEKCPPILMLI